MKQESAESLRPSFAYMLWLSLFFFGWESFVKIIGLSYLNGFDLNGPLDRHVSKLGHVILDTSRNLFVLLLIERTIFYVTKLCTNIKHDTQILDFFLVQNIFQPPYYQSRYSTLDFVPRSIFIYWRKINSNKFNYPNIIGLICCPQILFYFSANSGKEMLEISLITNQLIYP